MMKADAIAAELTTPSVATMGVDFFTIEHSGSDGQGYDPLGGPHPCGVLLDRRQVLVVLRRMGVRRREEWQVRGWRRDRVYEDDRPPADAYCVAFEVSASEFWWAHHPPPGAVT